MGKILIVEDDADLVETYIDLLQTQHHSVTAVSRAKDAILIVPRLKPDLILLDLNLAGYSGTIIINLVRRYPILKHTKIVVITGHPELLQHSQDISRVDHILNKPVSNESLLEVVSRFTNAKPS